MNYQTTIITYGGGEVLDKIFNGIAMLTSSGGIISLICGFTIFLGISIGVFKAYLGDFEGVNFKRYLLPLVMITLICFTPKSTVHIEDIFRHKVYNVDNIPILLAKSAEIISSCGYGVTQAFENVMHRAGDNYHRITPGDGGSNNYLTTGMIFGAESVLDLDRYRIQSGDFEQNLKRFSKQCIMFDLAHGKYSFDELKTTDHLWEFLKNRSSEMRMILYKPVDGIKNPNESFISCKEALKTLESAMGREKSRVSRNELLKHLPFAFKVLTGVQKEAGDLIGQQLMISYLASNFAGTEYAAIRARSQQKSTYLMVGSLASSSLITMRGVLEALVYAAFLFVMPMSLLPKGLVVLKSWFQMLIWIQLWTPFYAVINYIQQVSSHSYADSIFPSLANKSLTIATSVGLENLHQDMYALGGYLAMSIPFISYAVVWGGAQSFIHMAGSLLTPAHSAATTSAGELVSGNYNLANTNFGQSHYKNSSMLQSQSSPSISQGYFTENRGTHTLTYAGDSTVFHENLSSSRYNIDYSESISSTASEQMQHAQTALDTSQRSYSESISNHARNMADLTEHFGSSKSMGSGISSREASSLQQSANFVQNQVENFAKNHGMSNRDAFDCLMSVNPKLFGVGGGVSLNSGNYDENSLSEAKNLSKNEDFQKHFQSIADISKSDSYSSMQDEGKRLVESFSRSLDRVDSEQKQYSAALSNMESVSQTQSWIEQNSASLKENLNQSFFDFVSKNVCGTATAARLFQQNSAELKPLAERFISGKYQELKTSFSTMNPEDHFEKISTPKVSSNKPGVNEFSSGKELRNSVSIEEFGNNLESLFAKEMKFTDSIIQSQREAIQSESEKISGEIKKQGNALLIERGIGEMSAKCEKTLNTFANWVEKSDEESVISSVWKGASYVWDCANQAIDGAEKGCEMLASDIESLFQAKKIEDPENQSQLANENRLWRHK